MPRRFENPKELGIDVDPTNIEIIPPQDSDRLVDSVTMSPIMDGHIITFRTNDPVNAPPSEPGPVDAAMLTNFCFAYGG